jgi:hypothetical protein
MSDRKYNGWTNYETWCVNLWLTNDEGSDGYWRERAEDAWSRASADKTFTRKESAALALSDELKTEITDAAPGLHGYGLYSDLMTAALGEVDWYEIAQAFLEEYSDPEVES